MTPNESKIEKVQQLVFYATYMYFLSFWIQNVDKRSTMIELKIREETIADFG